MLLYLWQFLFVTTQAVRVIGTKQLSYEVNDTLFVSMKVKNARIVAEIPILTGRPIEEKDYEKIRGNRDPYGTEWLRWDFIPEYITRVLKSGSPKFIAKIVAYDPVNNPRRGMDRHSGLKILNKLGLIAPSTFQVMVLANQTLCKNSVLNICIEHNGRKLICLVPINPENPAYYFFGTGSDNGGTFRTYNYRQISGEKRLYFWHHEYAHDQGDEQYPDLTNHFGYHFPLLLGIQPA
jgi:hypothetical protein